nr:putative reverse transcriptase domain-containing protein [Tanacetum cinerariifolium]
MIVDGGVVFGGGSGSGTAAAGGDSGGGGSGVNRRRVRESDIDDRIDRSEGILFGFVRKGPPEKFSGGGGVVVAGGGGRRQEAASGGKGGRRLGMRERELFCWYKVKFLNGSGTISPWILSSSSQGHKVEMIPYRKWSRDMEYQSQSSVTMTLDPVEIMDREVKRLKQSRISIIKIRWNSMRGPEFTWEREDQFRKKYPQRFTTTAPLTNATY